MDQADLHTSAQLAVQCRNKFFTLAPDVDAVVSTDPVHIGYLSGYRSILQDMPAYKQAVIATRGGVVLVTGASDAAAALETLQLPQSIWRYGTFYVGQRGAVYGYADMPAASPDFMTALRAALSHAGLTGQHVGLDIPDKGDFDAVAALLTNARAASVTPLLLRARSTKLAGEVSRLRRASRITDDALALAAELVQAGAQEIDLAGEITRHIVRHGGIPRFVVVTSGERSALVDAYATPRALSKGELVRLDVGCTVDGYYSDMARTFTVGAPTAEQQARYQALLAGEQAQLDALGPGRRVNEIFELAVRTVRSGALADYERNHCGHGIGLRSHEYPMIAPNSDVALEPGMVVCVETPYYELGWGGMMVEDTALITDSGSELLTRSSRALVPQAG